MLFPTKLHCFLEMSSNDPKLSSIVSWLPCGTAFKIHDPVDFANFVLPKYFGGMHSVRSFHRQLNLYGIKKRLKSCFSLGGNINHEKTTAAGTAPKNGKLSSSTIAGGGAGRYVCCMSSLLFRIFILFSR